MFDGVMLDVAIGLLLVFLVSSLVASAVVEAIGGFLHRRSKNLWDTIDLMLGRTRLGGDDQRVVDLVYRQPFVTALVRPTSRRFFEPEQPAAGRAPLRGIASPAAPLDDAERKRRFYGPQHLPARDFAESLIEVIAPGGTADTTSARLRGAVASLPEGSLRTQLRSVVDAAGDDLADVRAGIEDWYERHMTSVSIWYRRQTRWFLFATGLVMAIAMNVDAIDTATTLYRDDDVRSAVVDTAAAVAGSVTVGAPFWFDLLRRGLALRKRE